MSRLGLLLFGIFLTACSPGTSAGSERTAEEWLMEMANLYNRSGIECEYAMEMQLPDSGDLGIRMEGRMIALDQNHSRVEMQMEMISPGSDSPVQMEIVTVADGETIWMEMELPPEIGGSQVMKLSLETAQKFSEKGAASGLGGLDGIGGMGSGNLDPLTQVQQLSRYVDFNVVEETSETVTLVGAMTEALTSQMGPVLAASTKDISRMTLVLDKNIGAPLVIALGDSARPFMEMRFTSYHLFKEPPHPDTFSYEPAGDVMVMDIGPMLEMMPGQGVLGTGGDEGEF
ncbi:MAG TPA: hypothetical protein DDW23_00105 [Planctomycetes bacterium]|nr:hypothetical protein [Planctomycetota bacterium]